MQPLSTSPGPERDAGPIAGLTLACMPATIAISICAVLPVLPKIPAAFPHQANIVALTPLVVVLPTLMVAVAGAIAGPLGDRMGRRRLLILATLVFAVAGIAPLFVGPFTLVLASRAITGLAMGGMITSAVGLTGDWFSGAPLQRWLSAQGGVAAISGIVVSAAGGALGEISWRLAFLPMFVGVPLLAAAILVSGPRAGAPATAATVSSGERAPAPWATWIPIFALAVACALSIFPPAYELGAVVKEKALGESWITGLGVSAMACGSAVAAFSVPRMRGLAPLRQVTVALVLGGSGAILIAQAGALIPILAGCVLNGAGQGMMAPILSIWLIEATPDRLRGRAVGVLQGLTFSTLFVGPLVARWVSISLGSSTSSMRVMAIANLVVLLAIAPAILRRRPAPATAGA